MIYGLYQSAAGVMTNAYRQDVISNNLANVETSGFKRDVTTFRQRLTAAQSNPMDSDQTNKLLEQMGGGMFSQPTLVDSSQGDLESSGNDLDAALVGKGYFTVAGANGKVELTRAGRFQIDKTGKLTLNTAAANPVLDAGGQPIVLDPTQPVHISKDGTISQIGRQKQRLGLLDVADPSKLKKEGGSLFTFDTASGTKAATATVEQDSLERANVDPATELTQLMETQRMLEANANMIHYQDQTLDTLINSAGKIT